MKRLESAKNPNWEKKERERAREKEREERIREREEREDPYVVNVANQIEQFKINFVYQNENFKQDMYEKVFSFSLFLKDDVIQTWKKAMENQPVNQDKYNSFITDYNKYVKMQTEAFPIICNSFKDFSILHIVDERILRLRQVENNVFTSTLQEYYKKWSEDQKFPYRLYSYTYDSQKFSSPYYGSIIRFIPLLFENINTAIFRDAHSTIPNPNYDYDLQWYKTWISKTNKKFWMYTSPWYNPDHAAGEHAPFAATWGARKIDKQQQTIWTRAEWNSVFGYCRQDENNSFECKPGYGVDERLFNLVRIQPWFMDSTYFVGMTWIFYLFYNPSYLEKYATNQGDAAKTLINLRGKNYYLRPTSPSFNTLSYYGNIKCQLLDFIVSLAKQLNKFPRFVTIDEFFDAIEKLQKQDIPGFKRFPSRYHLWEYLFKADTYGFNPNVGLLDYLENFGKNFGSNELLEKVCDNSLYEFIGDGYQPANNVFDTRNLSLIKLPDKHPLVNHRLINF